MESKLKFSLVILLAILSFSNHSYSQSNNKKNDQEYKVAAYYWPAYHSDPRWSSFFAGGGDEWEIIKSSKPKFDGHRQPRIPIWGYEDEANPKVMEKKIDAAVSHGVNVLAFDWYWYEGKPFLERCINEGFLGAENNNEIEFYIMWANHAATTLWNKEKSHKMDTIWNAEVDREQFEIITDRIIKQYMMHPSYLKIDGKPVFSIYELGTLIKGLGGIKETREALDAFRKKVIQAGFEGLHLQAILWGSIPDTQSNVPGDKSQTQDNTIRELGINSLTNYQFVHASGPVDNYYDWADKAISNWPKWEQDFSVPFFPHVAIDWDTNPRFYTYTPTLKENVNPKAFKHYLLMAKEYIDAHPDQPKMVTINSWNEWSEGSYLEPDSTHGMKYLEAVKEVFRNQ